MNGQGHPPLSHQNGRSGHYAPTHQQRYSLSSSASQFQGLDARAVPVPGAQSTGGGAMNMNGGGFSGSHHAHRQSASGAGEMSRSPPNNKNTSHVPCKFYLQGNCQAGKACPFKHSNDGVAQTEVCKYFQKGNCKYGRRCLLLHVLPDGQVVNGSTFGLSQQYPQQPRRSMDRNYSGPGAGYGDVAGMSPPSTGFMMRDDGPRGQRLFEGQLRSEPGLSSHPGSHPTSPYGSPPHHEGRLPVSPTINALSALETQLPSSFDSQGISNYAAFGPTGSSVPVRFGILPMTTQGPTTSTANSQAFGNLNRLARGDLNERERVMSSNQLASSPPSHMTATQPRHIIPAVDRLQQSTMVSSSLPMANRYVAEEDDLSGHEDLLPSSLHELFPDSRRRTSKEYDDAPSTRQSLSGFGSPNSSKVGSPSHASPPSRFHNFFKQRKEAEDTGMSAFGHVGSPLRNSSLMQDSGVGKTGFSSMSSSRGWAGIERGQISTSPRIGMLSQQLNQTRLDAGHNVDNDFLAPRPSPGGPVRTTSSTSIGSALSGRVLGDRTVSANSINKERIDEEPFFSMEEDEEQREKEQKKRESQQFGTIGEPRKLLSSDTSAVATEK